MVWDLETILRLAPPVIQAVSVAATAIFAIVGLRAWRRQLIGKRKIEVAEETLLAAYKVKSAMSFIRNPGSFGGEGQTRQRDDREPEDLARQRDTYFVPLERIQKTSEDFAQFEKARLLCQVYFGPTSDKPFVTILRARNKVAVAARMLYTSAGESGGQGALRQQWQANIWESYGSEGDPAKDAITKEVAEAVDEIEVICREHLKL